MSSRSRFAWLRAGAVQTGLLLRVVAGLAILVSVAAGTGYWMINRAERAPEPTAPTTDDETPVPNTGPKPGTVGGIPLFAGWPKDAPDLVLVLSGQTFGYLQPCGCSRPQLGGLERRYNFIHALKAKGWNVVGLDVGDIAPGKGLHEITAQSLKKYEYSMKALKEMGYTAAGLGKNDFAQQLDKLLGQYTLQDPPNKPPHLLAGNLVGDVVRDNDGKVTAATPLEKLYPPGDPKNPNSRGMVNAHEIVPDKNVPFVVVGLVGPSVAKKIVELDKTTDFQPSGAVLKATLLKAANSPVKPELKVLLYQGSADEAKELAKDFPEIQLIVCTSEESEPPQFPVFANDKKTQIVSVGHKGRYVGTVGIFKTKLGVELHYQLVPMGEEYLTPEKPEALKDHAVLKLLEEYSAEVKRADYLKEATKKRPPHAASVKNPSAKLEFIGSDACRPCHAGEFKVWSEHPHSKAYEALEKKATRPGLRNFDPECLSCHTTGFEYDTGFKNKVDTAKLINNGCENCHGPGSGHAAKPKDKELLQAMMSWRLNPDDKLPSKEYMEKMGKLDPLQRGAVEVPAAQQRLVNTISGMCMKCHDGDNDPKFDFYQYMPKLYHSGLKAAGLPGGAK